MSDDDGSLSRAYLKAKNRSTSENIRRSIEGWREQMPISNAAVFLINVATVALGVAIGYHYPNDALMLAFAVALAGSGVYGIVDGPVRRYVQ